MKKIISLVLMLSLCIQSIVVFGASNIEVDFVKTQYYSSEDIYKTLNNLVKENPNLLEMEEIGKSFDKKPIYVVRMTGDMKTYQEEMKKINQKYVNFLNPEKLEIRETENNKEVDGKFYFKKKNYLIEGGTHSRENMPPGILLKMIDDYTDAYNSNSKIDGYNVKELLNKSVIHFIVISNPDGFDLAKFGTKKIKTKEGLSSLKSLKDTNYGRYKSNLRGVDLNRNYASDYFNVKTNKWEDLWGKNVNKAYFSSKPAKEFFPGKVPLSEPETKSISEYLVKYDFRNYISYHSQGHVIYYDRYTLSKKYNTYALKLAKGIASKTKYTIMGVDNNPSYGFMGDFIAMKTLKPVLTVEVARKVPTFGKSYTLSEYQAVDSLPLYFITEGEKRGYLPYRMYINGVYVRDFEEKEYADGFAKKYKGVIIESKGTPVFKIKD